MATTLKNNAYHILGLDTSASETDILKRSKEIINRLRVDNMPEYHLDIDLFEDFRTDKTVKDALQRLQVSKKRINEYFFWFQIADGIDEQALKCIKLKDYKSAIHIWEVASNGETTKAYLYKKNLAILQLLLLEVNDSKEYLRSSVSLWKSLIDSEKFWTLFFKLYKLHNEQTVSQKIFTDFMDHASSNLADIYTELHLLHDDTSYINEFQTKFSIKGEKIEKNILAPAYEIINNASEKLQSMQVSADGILDKQEKDTIKELVGIIRSELNNLIDLGLYNDSQTKVMRDKAADALRSLSIDLHNNLDETEIALGVAKIAEEISGMESSKSKIQADVATLQGNIEYKEKEVRLNKIIEPILQQIKAGKSEKALEDINRLLYGNNTNIEVKEALQELKQTIEERIVKYGKPIGSPPGMQTLNGVGTKIYGDTLYFVILFVPIIPIARYTLEDHHDGSYSFFGKLDLHKWQKYWQYIGIGSFCIWIFSIILNG